MVVPLDEQYVTVKSERTGGDEIFPALHPRWKENIQFLLYQAPPSNPADRAGLEEWLERVTFIGEDLHRLLQMSHDRFWCQVVFDETLQRSIDSYLRFAPRDYDIIFNLDEEAKQRQNAVHKLFFLLCLRMATHKESKDHHITPKVFGDILYENFIFDIPKLMDMSVLYGPSNGPLLSKMVANVFLQQPKYEEDLRSVMQTIVEVFKTIQSKCGIRTNSAPSSPEKLNAPPSKKPSLATMSASGFQDIVFYLSDTAHTLSSFLEVYPAGAKVFFEGDFLTRIASTYESLVPVLGEAIKSREWASPALQDAVKLSLRKAQISLLKFFRGVIFQCCLQPILENSEALDSHIEDYLQVMSAVMTERRFLAHHETLYPFEEDRELVLQSAYSIDETRLQFVAEGVSEAYNLFGKKRQNTQHSANTSGNSGTSGDSGAMANEETDKFTGAVAGAELGAGGRPPPGAGAEAGAAPPRVTGIQLESLICSVKDLFPNLGEGFIEVCLEELNYNAEAVINALLEDKLPPSLDELDRDLARDPSQAFHEEDVEDTSLVGQRKNVYDNDEFDVFSRDNVDLSKIHKGKKEKNKDGMALLDDKTTVDDLRPLYDKYGGEFAESAYEGMAGEYEDEYDDTYDSVAVGADDADSADELLARRAFTVPRILQLRDGDSNPPSDNVSEEDDDRDQEEGRNRRDDFVEDPAKMRERQAQRYAQRQANRGRGRGRGHGQGEGQRNRDVKGGATGQGQSADVLRNRAAKEKTKSTRVHHNRKVLADKKRKF